MWKCAIFCFLIEKCLLVLIEVGEKRLETNKKLEEVFNYIATNIKVKKNIFSVVKYMKHLALLLTSFKMRKKR